MAIGNPIAFTSSIDHDVYSRLLGKLAELERSQSFSHSEKLSNVVMELPSPSKSSQRPRPACLYMLGSDETRGSDQMGDNFLMSTARWCMQQVCDGSGVDIGGLVQLRKHMSKALGIPEEAFGSMHKLHLCFNLSGSGRLSENELYLLLKMTSEMYQERTRGAAVGSMPLKSLASAGYTIKRRIASGNQSSVLLAASVNGPQRCVKAFEKSKPVAGDTMKHEVKVLRSLTHHSSVTSCLDAFQDDGFWYIVQPVCEGGDFSTLRQKLSPSLLDEKWWVGIFRQCFEGVAHLHQNGVIHCDLKESNLMLKTSNYQSPVVVIVDFGVAQSAADVPSFKVSGTPGYIPPESWEDGKWYPAGDVFSMGVVIMQMLLNRVPPHHNPPVCEVLPGGIFTQGLTRITEVAEATRTCDPPYNSMPPSFSMLTVLLQKMLEKDVRRRPQAQQVLRDAWFHSSFSKSSDKSMQRPATPTFGPHHVSDMLLIADD